MPDITMKILQYIQDFEVNLTGGFAIYGLLCILYVTVSGLGFCCVRLLGRFWK